MKAKVRNAQLASRLGGEPKQWRGPRRNRFQGSIIKKKILDSENFQLSSALARMYTALEQGGRGSPSAAIGVVLDDNGESPVVGGWIRKTHLSEQNRRSPIFTGRFFGRDELDDSNPRRGGQFGPHERSGGPQMGNSSRPSISERLGPRVESPSREQFDSQNASQWSYHKANRQYEPAGPRYGEDYPPGRYSRDHFSPQPQRSQDYGRSQADYHSDYYGSSERDASRDPRPMQWNQRSDYDYPAGYPEYDDRMNGDYRRRSEDYNNGPYSRDNYPPQSARRSYRQALYYPPSYTSPRQEYMMDQRQMGSRQDQPSDNYSAYPPNYRDSYYDDERRNAWHSYSNSQMDDYNSNMGQQRPRNFRESTYYSQDMSSPRYDSMMMQQQQQQRSWMEPPMNRPGPGKQGFYQDRFSDEDFSDSESGEEDNKPKMAVRKMWKNLVRERGVLIAHVGECAKMTREYAEHVKKSLLEKAMDSNVNHKDEWIPRFMRGGLVTRTGLYQLVCQDFKTLRWTLQQEIPPLEGHTFCILRRPYDWDCGPVRVNTWIPAEPVDPQEALGAIEAENPGIGSSRWRIVAVNYEDGWRQVVADIGCESSLYLEKKGWTILFWTNVLPVTRMTKKPDSSSVQEEVPRQQAS